jgi:hypothetical protein
MKNKVVFALFVVSALAVLAGITREILRAPGGVYQGKNIRAWVRSAVLDSDPKAKATLEETISYADAADRARIQRECILCVTKALHRRNSPFWKPYDLVKTKCPSPLGKWLPQWREPKATRRAAALWLCSRRPPWNLESAVPGLQELASPFLCKLAKNDSDQAVRQAAIWVLSHVGAWSEESFDVMTSAVGHTSPDDRRAAARWFARHTPAPERIVPVLLQGLEDNAMRSDYAEALRAYGPRARFVVEPLVALAKTNDRATSSVASWALVGIDPEAAAKAGVRW